MRRFWCKLHQNPEAVGRKVASGSPRVILGLNREEIRRAQTIAALQKKPRRLRGNSDMTTISRPFLRRRRPRLRSGRSASSKRSPSEEA